MSDLHTMNDAVNTLREVITQRDLTIKELEDGLEKGKDYCVSLSKTVTELTIENESRYKRIKELERHSELLIIKAQTEAADDLARIKELEAEAELSNKKNELLHRGVA